MLRPLTSMWIRLGQDWTWGKAFGKSTSEANISAIHAHDTYCRTWMECTD